MTDRDEYMTDRDELISANRERSLRLKLAQLEILKTGHNQYVAALAGRGSYGMWRRRRGWHIVSPRTLEEWELGRMPKRKAIALLDELLVERLGQEVYERP